MWIYSHKLDASYLPVCKAGCTSITAALLIHENIIDRMPEGDGSEVHQMLWYPMGRHNAVLIHGMAARVRHNGAALKPRRPFTFVRHPLARVLSCYRDKVLGDRPWLASHLKVQPFSEFVKRVCDENPAELDLHLRPQSVILDGLELMFVGKTECMKQHWMNLSERFGWPAAPELPRLNSTGDQAWSNEYDDETFAIAEDYYRSDLERFNYAV